MLNSQYTFLFKHDTHQKSTEVKKIEAWTPDQKSNKHEFRINYYVAKKNNTHQKSTEVPKNINSTINRINKQHDS